MTDQNWQHASTKAPSIGSTGPNWYDIQLNYTSTDGSVKITADIWETPQAELRSFFRVRYDTRAEPLVIVTLRPISVF